MSFDPHDPEVEVMMRARSLRQGADNGAHAQGRGLVEGDEFGIARRIRVPRATTRRAQLYVYLAETAVLRAKADAIPAAIRITPLTSSW